MAEDSKVIVYYNHTSIDYNFIVVIEKHGINLSNSLYYCLKTEKDKVEENMTLDKEIWGTGFL